MARAANTTTKPRTANSPVGRKATPHDQKMRERHQRLSALAADPSDITASLRLVTAAHAAAWAAVNVRLDTNRSRAEAVVNALATAEAKAVLALFRHPASTVADQHFKGAYLREYGVGNVFLHAAAAEAYAESLIAAAEPGVFLTIGDPARKGGKTNGKPADASTFRSIGEVAEKSTLTAAEFDNAGRVGTLREIAFGASSEGVNWPLQLAAQKHFDAWLALQNGLDGPTGKSLDSGEIEALMNLLRCPAGNALDQRYKGRYLAELNTWGSVDQHEDAAMALVSSLTEAPLTRDDRDLAFAHRMKGLESPLLDATHMARLLTDKLDTLGNEKGNHDKDIISFSDGEMEAFFFSIYNVRNRLDALLKSYLAVFDVYKTTANVGPVTTPAAAVVGSDAELLRLAAEFDAVVKEYDAEGNREYPKTQEGNRASDKALNAVFDRVQAVHQKMLPLRATTLAGLQAKAKVCQWTVEIDGATGERGEFYIPDEETTDNKFASSIVRDLVAMTAAHQPGGAPTEASAPAAARPNLVVPARGGVYDLNDLDSDLAHLFDLIDASVDIHVEGQPSERMGSLLWVARDLAEGVRKQLTANWSRINGGGKAGGDERLMELIARWHRERDIANDDPTEYEDGSDDPNSQRLWATEDEIMKLAPRTAEGFAAKFMVGSGYGANDMNPGGGDFANTILAEIIDASPAYMRDSQGGKEYRKRVAF